MGRQDKVVIDDVSDDEDAAITAAAEADPDNPPLTDQQLARMRPVWAVPDVAAALRRAGALPEAAPDRVAVTLRLDPDVLDALRRAEAGWEDHANALLRRALGV